MKIEKVNDNQIRCTLTREDLNARQIKLSELAYGSEKARDLFSDMIEQANYEFGFEINDIPLMVEAIPLSAESIILVITKVEYPEELDIRFSKFSEMNEDLYPSQEEAKAPKPVKLASIETDNDLTKMFELKDIEQACRVSHMLNGYYNGLNDLYKDRQNNRYYLVLHMSSHTPVEYNKVCNMIAEYAIQKTYSPLVEAYFMEHGDLIIKENALQSLVSI